MSFETSFHVTETMDELLQDDELSHTMVTDLIEQSSNMIVESVPLSMTGRNEEVLRTGVLVIDDTEYGFQVLRSEDDDQITVTVEIEAISDSLKETDTEKKIDA